MEPLAGLMIGLAGSLHCAGMCGPIAMALPRSSGSTGRFVFGRFLYQFGRIGTYVVLGALFGLGASAISLAGYEQIISISAGVLMVITALMQILWHKSVLPTQFVTKVTAPVRSSMQRLLKQDSLAAMSGLGAVNGLLPCGLVMSALFGSAATTSTLDGALFMGFFGLGTLPVMATLSLGGGWISGLLKGRTKIAIPVVVLLLGTAFIVRGMGLGIPYLSPKPPSSGMHTAESHAEECHCH